MHIFEKAKQQRRGKFHFLDHSKIQVPAYAYVIHPTVSVWNRNTLCFTQYLYIALALKKPTYSYCSQKASKDAGAVITAKAYITYKNGFGIQGLLLLPPE